MEKPPYDSKHYDNLIILVILILIIVGYYKHR